MSLEARAEAARRRMQEGMGAVDEAAAIGQYMEQGRMSEVALGQQIGESVKQGGQIIGQALSGTGYGPIIAGGAAALGEVIKASSGVDVDPDTIRVTDPLVQEGLQAMGTLRGFASSIMGTGQQIGAVPGTGQAGDTPETPDTPFTPETPETPDTTAGMRVFKSPRYA